MSPRDNTLSRSVSVVLALALLTPVVGLVILLTVPSTDSHWDHEPSHFWIVFGAAAIAALLGWSVGTSARRRSDGRLFLISMSFVSSAVFLGLHALATPGVLLDGRNTGFVVAVPVGLALAAAFALWSAIPLDGPRARWIIRHAVAMRSLVFALVAGWAIWSLVGLPPLDNPSPPETRSAFMVVLAVPAAVAFLVAAYGYLRLNRERHSALLIAVSAAWVLLAEASVAVGLTESWRYSWWSWHAVILFALGAIAFAASRLPENERFADLYLDEVAGGTRTVSVLFADLQGFTRFSEEHPPEEVQAMLNAYFEAVLPAVRASGGRLDKFIGDAVMVTFNVAIDQSDHAQRALRAALDFQAAADGVAARHPDWPRFRVGVNTGNAAVGVVGDRGQRDYTVLGDTVNVASRIESLAPLGGIAISDATRRSVPGVRVVSLGTVTVKGRGEPIEIWRADGLED